MDFDESEQSFGTTSDLVDALTSSEVEPDPDGRRRFESKSPDWWPGGRTFGGMVVGQALNAAMRTVDPDLELHSLHGYFLRPSTPAVPTLHLVDAVREGRSFALREVLSRVEGKEVFRMLCSFHRPESGDEYQLPMASVVSPEEGQEPEFGFPFEMRELGTTERRSDGSYESTRRVWFRASEPLPDDPIVHASLLTYLSDMTGASFRPLSMTTWGTHTDASLDHTVWFHRPWRADTWSLFDLQAVVNAGGRATVRATMHGEDGTLHLSMAQELLIRELDEPIIFDSPMARAQRRKEEERGSDGAA